MNEKKIKPEKVHIKSINTSTSMSQNPMTNQVEQNLQVIGLGDDDKIYIYDGLNKEWILL